MLLDRHVKERPIVSMAGMSGGPASYILYASTASGGYEIARSLKFNSGDSSFLETTFSRASTTYTFSCWVKLGELDSYEYIFASGSSGLAFDGSSFYYYVLNGSAQATTAKFRDTSAWYHLCLSVNNLSFTLYVNGVNVKTGTAAALSTSSNASFIGKHEANNFYFNGYLADVQLLDGIAASPTAFGETDDDGVWQPKSYEGDYNSAGTGAVYSGMLTASTVKTATNGFDGNTSTRAEGTGGLTFTPVGGISYSSSVEVHDVHTVTKSKVNNGSFVTHTNGWVTVASGSGTLNTLYAERTDDAAYDAGFTAIRVDGTILTDGTPAGENGFHLKFSDNSTDASLGYDTSSTSNTTTPGQNFKVVTYTGTGSDQHINVGFEPGIVWIKSRNHATYHQITDTVRGQGNRLYPNENSAQTYKEDNLTGFTKQGFQLGADSNADGCNVSGKTYVAWCWKADSEAVTNRDGSILSSVSANTSKGFSIVQWQGTGADGTVGHGLGANVAMMIVKNYGESADWIVWHKDLDDTTDEYLHLNKSDAVASSYDVWNDTAPTSSLIHLGTNGHSNSNGKGIVAYCWSEVAGYSKFSSYTGNGGSLSVTGLGFKPNFVLIRPTGTGSWMIFDAARGVGNYLKAQTSGTEVSASISLSFDSDGFSMNTSDSDFNGDGNKYLYMAFVGDVGNHFNTHNFTASTGDTTPKQNFASVAYTGDGGTQPIGGPVYSDSSDSSMTSAAQIFNGSTSNGGYFPGTGTNKVLTTSPFTINTQLRVYNNFRSDGTYAICLNDTCVNVAGSGTNSSAFRWSTVDLSSFTLPLDVTKLGYSLSQNSGNTLMAIEVDSNILIDGNGSTISFSPDLVWIKSRSATYDHALFDTVRGPLKRLRSNQTNTENTDSTTLTTFNSDGFTTGSDDVTNKNNDNYVAWMWNAGANSNKTYTVKVVSDSGNKYRFDNFGTSAVTLDLAEGSTYVFDQSDSSNANHPLRFSTTSNGSHGGGSEYTTGVTVTGTPGQAGAKTTIVVASSAPTLYYYCTQHSGMGGQANTNSTQGSTNFDGSTKSVVKANTAKGFSIVSWENASGTITVGHGLNARPQLIFTKSRDTSNDWQVYANSIGNDKKLILNGTSNSSSSSNWGSTDPTPSVFTINDGTTDSWIAYCWSEVPGFSKFGKYSGTGSDQTITCGFRPAFVMIKSDSTTGEEWMVYDSARNTTNPRDKILRWNQNTEEGTYQQRYVDFDDNGFSFPGSSGLEPINYNGRTYIYMAFAENDNGESCDSLVDSPEQRSGQNDSGAGGEVVGNFATLNPLALKSGTLSDGNLRGTVPTDSTHHANFAIPDSGKWYFEAQMTNSGILNFGLGAYRPDGHVYSNPNAIVYSTSGVKNVDAVTDQSYGSSWTVGDIIGCACDADAGTITFYKNGVSQGALSHQIGGLFPVFGNGGASTDYIVNFGQRPFNNTPPSNHKALNTANLPTAAITDGSTAFAIPSYTGNGSSGQTVTGLKFSPDFVWFKSRSETQNHAVFDTIRGVEKRLQPNLTQLQDDSASGLTAFNSDGFTFNSNNVNGKSGVSYLSWTWDGGDLVSDSSYDQSKTWSGQMTSTGNGIESANPATSLFNGVTTGLGMRVNGSSSATWTPVGGYAFTSSVVIYCAGDGNVSGTQFTCVHAGGTLDFSSSVTSGTTNTAVNLTDLGITSPITSITITSGNNNPRASAIVIDSKTLVDAGVIPVGGLNSTVYNQSQTWSSYLTSSTGSFYNNQGADKAFDGDIGTQAEPSSTGGTLTFTPTSAITFNSTVEIMSGGGDKNVSFNGGTALSTGTANTWKTVASGGGTLTTLSISKSGDWPTFKGIRIDGKILVDSGTTPPNVPTIAPTVRRNSTAGFSIGKFEGTGSTGTIATGLSNTKMVILKNRSDSSNWVVYHNILDGSYDYMYLNLTDANASSGLAPFAMNYTFKVGSNTDTNASGDDYVFYAFSPIAGYSAFGTYVGDASTKPFIYTGMRPRFVMIKCTNNTSYGYWFMFDTTRSTFNVVSDETALAANLSDGEGISNWNSNGPGDNALDILSNGFKMKLNSTNGLNNTGDTYLYAAFAEHPFNNSRAR